MGNKAPQGSQISGVFGHTRMGLINVIKNPNYGQMTDEDCTQLMILVNRTVSKSQLAKWHDEIKLYKLNIVRDYLLLPVGEQITSGGYCGSNCHVDLQYPKYTFVLREQIKNRWKIDKMYEETELWYLLYNLVVVGRHFEIMGKKIGNIHPNNILINDEGWMKVISLYSIPYEKDNFNIICESQLEDVFLAPEEIDYDCIKRNLYPTKIDPNQAELFSIGMTLLEAGTLELSTYTYDKGPYRVNFTKVRENLNIFKNKYGIKLYNIVESLLMQSPKNRKTCRQIYDMLQPYKAEILSLEPFQDKTKTTQPQRYGQSLHYSKSSREMNQTTLLNINQSYSEMAETKIIHSPSNFSSQIGTQSLSRPLPVNQARQRYPQPSRQIRFYSPRNDVVFRNY